MKNLDVIIISWAKDNELYKTTNKGLKSLLSSESTDTIKINPIIVESNKKINWDFYPNTKTIYTDKPFGYHRYLNLGILSSNSEYICLSNNDLIYEKRWASAIINEMEKDKDLMSACPFCPQTLPVSMRNSGNHYGYIVREHLGGWCIFQRRDIYNKIGSLDEDVEFWYSDNIYADELKLRNIKHALITTSVVNHHEKNLGKTGEIAIDGKTRLHYTRDQFELYTKKVNELNNKLMNS